MSHLAKSIILVSLLCFSVELSASGDLPVTKFHTILEITGESDHALKMPADIVVSKQDRLYVVDAGNHRIQVYALNGTYLFSFGSQGDGPGQFGS